MAWKSGSVGAIRNVRGQRRDNENGLFGQSTECRIFQRKIVRFAPPIDEDHGYASETRERVCGRSICSMLVHFFFLEFWRLVLLKWFTDHWSSLKSYHVHLIIYIFARNTRSSWNNPLRITPLKNTYYHHTKWAKKMGSGKWTEGQSLSPHHQSCKRTRPNGNENNYYYSCVWADLGVIYFHSSVVANFNVMRALPKRMNSPRSCSVCACVCHYFVTMFIVDDNWDWDP